MTGQAQLFEGSLLLVAVAFPVYLPVFFDGLRAGFTGDDVDLFEDSTRWLAAHSATLALLLALLWYRQPSLFAVEFPPTSLYAAPPRFYAIAVGAAVLALAGETLVAYVPVAVRKRALFVPRLTVPPVWRDLSAGAYLLGLASVVAEELLFRQFLFGVVRDLLGGPALAAVALSAVVFGINHVYFSPTSVAQKTVSGAVYGGLFVASGYVVAVPIVCHYAQNLLVAVVGE